MVFNLNLLLNHQIIFYHITTVLRRRFTIYTGFLSLYVDYDVILVYLICNLALILRRLIKTYLQSIETIGRKIKV